MWRVRYNLNGHPAAGFFSVCSAEADDSSVQQPSFSDYIPYSGINSVYDTHDRHDSKSDFPLSQSTPDVDLETWIRIDYEGSTINFLPETQSEPEITTEYPGRVSAHAHPSHGDRKYSHLENSSKTSSETATSKADPQNTLYGNHTQILWAILVRILLVGHNILAVWRVVEVYNNNLFWLIAIGNVFLLLELHVVIVKRAGVDFSWWTPSFLLYLLTTLPTVWLLQLQLYDAYVTENAARGPGANTTNIAQEDDRLELDNSLWIIIVQESLVYLLVFCRWLLPRGNVSRVFLADLLLEFLAIASDIMELLVVFEEDAIRGSLSLTCIILAVWSVSFIQFVPVLMHKRRFRHVRHLRVKCIGRVFGDKFVEVVATLMNILLQDLPFLVVRLYVIFVVHIVSYSLMFFVIKNVVTLLLLFYRLFIISRHLPACRKRSKEDKEQLTKNTISSSNISISS